MKPAIIPVVWSPPHRSTRSQRPRAPLPPLRLIPLPARGEDVAIDHEGRLIAGLADGRIVRLHDDGSALETLANTGGRPLGIEVAEDGSIIVCDPERGLLRIDPSTRRCEVLLARSQQNLRLCDNAAVARDGTIYFSDSSRRFDLAHWRADLVEHSGTGRLLRRTPDGKIEIVLEGLQFANGVTLAADESFVAVAETGAYRVLRYWLQGERRGWTEVLAGNLPGFPDNLATNPAGHIWIAIASPRNPVLDFLHRSRPVLRQAIWALPERLQPAPARLVGAIAVDTHGGVVHDLRGESPAFHMVTGLRERAGTLYLASLEEPAIAALTLPAPERAADLSS